MDLARSRSLIEKVDSFLGRCVGRDSFVGSTQQWDSQRTSLAKITDASSTIESKKSSTFAFATDHKRRCSASESPYSEASSAANCHVRGLTPSGGRSRL